jgi:hypothetical protein
MIYSITKPNCICYTYFRNVGCDLYMQINSSTWLTDLLIRSKPFVVVFIYRLGSPGIRKFFYNALYPLCLNMLIKFSNCNTRLHQDHKSFSKSNSRRWWVEKQDLIVAHSFCPSLFVTKQKVSEKEENLKKKWIWRILESRYPYHLWTQF